MKIANVLIKWFLFFLKIIFSKEKYEKENTRKENVITKLHMEKNTIKRFLKNYQKNKNEKSEVVVKHLKDEKITKNP